MKLETKFMWGLEIFKFYMGIGISDNGHNFLESGIARYTKQIDLLSFKTKTNETKAYPWKFNHDNPFGSGPYSSA